MRKENLLHLPSCARISRHFPLNVIGSALILWESSPGPPFVSASSTTNISSASLIDLIGPLKRQEKENRTTYATSIDPTYDVRRPNDVQLC